MSAKPQMASTAAPRASAAPWATIPERGSPALSVRGLLCDAAGPAPVAPWPVRGCRLLPGLRPGRATQLAGLPGAGARARARTTRTFTGMSMPSRPAAGSLYLVTAATTCSRSPPKASRHAARSSPAAGGPSCWGPTWAASRCSVPSVAAMQASRRHGHVRRAGRPPDFCLQGEPGRRAPRRSSRSGTWTRCCASTTAWMRARSSACSPTAPSARRRRRSSTSWATGPVSLRPHAPGGGPAPARGLHDGPVPRRQPLPRRVRANRRLLAASTRRGARRRCARGSCATRRCLSSTAALTRTTGSTSSTSGRAPPPASGRGAWLRRAMPCSSVALPCCAACAALRHRRSGRGGPARSRICRR